MLLLLILAVVFLWPVLFGGKALLPADYLSGMHPWSTLAAAQSLPQWNPLVWDGIAQFYPWRMHYSRTVAGGEVPLWNPHQFCGTPFAANAQTAVFYPPNALFLLWDPARAFGVSALLHLFLAGAFTFLLARALGMGRFGSLVSAITFQFSAFMVVWLELPTLVDVATWLPLALYLILKASDRVSPVYACFAGLAVGLSILAGHLQIASYVIEAAMLWWVWLTVGRARAEGAKTIWAQAVLAVLTFGVGFLIAAPQVLPTLELAGLSHRVRDITTEGYARYVGNAIPIRNLITAIVPGFYGNPATNSFWGVSSADYLEYGLYVGILPIVLAIVGAILAFRWRSVGYFAALAILALLFAFGTPINAILYYLVPGSSALGGPNRMIVLFCFAAAMLAGFGAQWFMRNALEEYSPTKRKLGWRALVISTAVFVVIAISAQTMSSGALSEIGVDVATAVTRAFNQYLSFFVMLLAGLGVLALYTAGQLPRPFFGGLVLAVIVADLFSFGFGFNPTAYPSHVYPNTPLTDWLKRNAGQDRIAPINSTWDLRNEPDAVLPPNAATVYGFCDMQGYDSLFSKRYKEFVDTTLGMDSSPQENGNMLFIKAFSPKWPVGYVVSRQPIENALLKEVADINDTIVYKAAGTPGYRAAYLLNGGEDGRAQISARSVNSVTVSVESSRPARLVLSDAFYPGWIAEVDGARREVGLAEGIFRSVPVGPGEHIVRFRFQPGSFIVGGFLGLLGIAVLGGAVGAALRKQPR